MIKQFGSVYVMDTEHTTYAFWILPSGHPEHLYYGKKIRITCEEDALALVEKHPFSPGNTNQYDADNGHFSLEDIRLEFSSYGKGDIREPLMEIVHKDGSYTSDYLFEKAEISDCKEVSQVMPNAYTENGKEEQLKVTYRDKQYGLRIEMFYCVYADCDVITRKVKLYNDSDDAVCIKRLLSQSIDLDPGQYTLHTFTGAWTREMHKNEIPLTAAGRYVNASYTGTTSSRANSFIMVSESHASENQGICYGFHLIYSGNHYEAVEVSSFGKVRIATGINPQSFAYQLGAGEVFETPEAALTVSYDGFGGMSHNMHEFVREHIVRGEWKKKVRPILINSWEANYFDINESKLLKLAKEAKNVGMELFVMDDGWFGERNDDTSSLGDWFVNEKKLPNGLDGLCKKINALGLDFGIWVEPEMVNVKSKLYEAHPEWVIQHPNNPHAEGRNQRILDLTQTVVQDYIIEKMSDVFSATDIKYVKWDMNRTFTDYFSQDLPADQQGEVAHRYVLGLYRCMKELTQRFPHILFEGCSAGGNRFDLGILSYFPQIWASDDTDALCRLEIQTGYSYGYPMSVVSAHVSSCPNHQTLRVTPLETRFHVASMGVCGYECNLCDMKAEELEAIKEQVALYKEWREVLQFGDFYRNNEKITNQISALSHMADNHVSFTVVSKDQKRAVGILMQKLVVPNTQYACYNARGLQEDVKYHFYNRDLKYNVKAFGDLVNTVAPIHIKQDSLAHNLIAKFVKMDGETEDYQVYGDTLMYSGVKLKAAFAGTGYSEEVRYFPDFGSRLYFMEAIQ